ncbi:Protein TONNEAU 1b [Phytophthora citrophthora]|uniref:Protein TONNEAU 1b n=1 Tax=Phytophthora citrophthora TaxID=4793 RepID=A0AAD9H194_9STRA|nr:Protein TONNEAU 1b [Phytophthora citrophthora]
MAVGKVSVLTMLSVLQPPPTAEELALKEQVTQILTNQGVLAKLKAELRAAVFEVMHEREGFVKPLDPQAPKLNDFPIETRTIALSLVIECLRFFHWEHALRVLLTEANEENEQFDAALLVKKLGLTGSESSKPVLFQLIESRAFSGEQTVASPAVTATKYDHYDEDEEDKDEIRLPTNSSVPAVKPWEIEVEAQLASKVTNESTQDTKEEAKDEDGEDSAEIEESMAEEVPSGSELEESNYTNYGEEESQDRSTEAIKQPTTPLFTPKLQEEDEDGDMAPGDGKESHESDDEDEVSLAEPPPAPTKLPSLPPLVTAPTSTLVGDAEDDFDAEEEAERLRKLDAALQAMEAEDDTGTLQQLKASLQMELREQDSLLSSGGIGKAEDEEEAEASKADDDGYGSSDFEEEEEIASEISEEMESMPDLSDKEDESEDGVAGSAAEAEPPRVLQNDTRVDSEDALNSYDYIENVEKW